MTDLAPFLNLGAFGVVAWIVIVQQTARDKARDADTATVREQFIAAIAEQRGEFLSTVEKMQTRHDAAIRHEQEACAEDRDQLRGVIERQREAIDKQGVHLADLTKTVERITIKGNA